MTAGLHVLTLGDEEGGDEEGEAADDEAGTFTIRTSPTRLYLSLIHI